MNSPSAALIVLLGVAGCASRPSALAAEALDLEGNPVHPLAAEAAANVLLFVRTDCPISNRYAPTVRELMAGYSDDRVRLWVIYVDPDETVEQIRRHLDEYDLPGVPLRDLHHELVASKDWALVPLGRVLQPLAMLAGARLGAWLVTLHRPIRSGVHSQTAFSLGLVLDWSRATETDGTTALLTRRIMDYHGEDPDLPLHLEPSGEDFLSPSLGTADLMSRVLGPEDFAAWLTTALPNLADVDLTPVSVMDESDGRLAHLDGLNLSRAWMLKAIGEALPEDDPRRPRLEEQAQAHADAGLGAIQGRPYEGTHWLGTFAAYLITGRPG